MKSGTALRAVGAGWLRTKVVESGLPAGRDREVLNSGLLLAFSEIEVRDRAQLVVRPSLAEVTVLYGSPEQSPFASVELSVEVLG